MTTSRKYEKRLYIDMDFDEALKRFGTTDPKELPDNIKLSRKPRATSKQKPVRRKGEPPKEA